jgi:hypothetical protein
MQKYCLSITLLILLWTAAADAQKTTSSLRIQGDSLISLRGRRVLLSQQGFPQQITTFFTADGKDTTGQPTNILAENIHFHFTGLGDGKDIRLKSGELTFTERSAGRISWNVTSMADGLSVYVVALIKPDGALEYTVKVTALQDLDLKDIVMHIPFQKDVAKYVIGLGLKGAYHPDSLFHWKWDPGITDQPDGAWIGTDNTGLQYALLGLYPWINDGKGGIDIGNKGKSMLASNYSGARHLQKGDVLYYNFSLLITLGKLARE